MIKILVATFLIILTLQAKHIHWLGDYDKALEKAHNDTKPLMIFLVKKKCHACNDILQDVLMNQPYIKTLNERFIPVIVTYEGSSSYPVEMYYSTTFPVLFFINSFSEAFLTKPLYGKAITRQKIQEFLNE